MFGNDQYGDCVMAAIFHAMLSWTGVSGNPTGDTSQWRQECVSTYFKLTGGADNGLVIIDTLNYWTKNAIAGNKLAGFVSINPSDIEAIKLAIWMFGGADFGVNLCNAWQGTNIWAPPPGGKSPRVGPYAPGSWGGHSIFGFDYNEEYLFVRSWAEKVYVPWASLPIYFSEVHVPLDELWVSALTEESASGFNWAALNNDLPSVGA
jgi:hypothetical protein